MSDNLNSKKLNVTLNLPLEWVNKLEELRQKQGQELAETITEIIGKNLELNLQEFQVNKLKQKYQHLEKRLALLESKDYDIESLYHRLEIMEKLMSQLQTQRFSAPSAIAHLPLAEDDEIEDEPDEILTDFLL